jgi:hypothetical protein
MKSKSTQQKTKEPTKPARIKIRIKQVDPDEFELDLEKQNMVLKKMTSKLEQKKTS